MADENALLVTLQTMQKSLKRVMDSYKALSKALDRFDKNEALDRQDYLGDAIAALKTTDLTLIGCADQKELVCRGLEDRLHSLRLNAHRALVTGLTELVENKNHIKIISDNPLVIYVHPLTLEVNFETAKAKWTYAHEDMATTSLDPKEIMSVHADLLNTFRALRIESSQFFGICHMAYQMALIRNGLKIGDRVDIVELLAPLSWLWPDTPSSKKSAFQLPRYLLAYQLQKLRGDKMLQANGLRLDLGAATGGTTRNKSNVLYVPQGATEGQYYLTICFRSA